MECLSVASMVTHKIYMILHLVTGFGLRSCRHTHTYVHRTHTRLMQLYVSANSIGHLCASLCIHRFMQNVRLKLCSLLTNTSQQTNAAQLLEYVLCVLAASEY